MQPVIDRWRHVLGKRQEIEIVRILSAFGIVWFHTASVGNDIGLSGLVVFIILSLYFAAGPGAAVKSIGSRFRRLILPWLFWYVFYALLNVALKRPVIQLERGWIAGVLTGPSVHLWYMPFMFAVLVMIDRIRTRIDPRLPAILCGMAVVPILASAAYWRFWSFTVGAPWAQYLQSVAAVLLGFFLANNPFIPWSITVFLLTVAGSTALAIIFVPGIGIPYFIGISVTALCLFPDWTIRPRPLINRLAECTLGIYLSHPFWNFVVTTQAHLSGTVIPLVVFTLSTLSVFLLRRLFPHWARHVL
jgi:fucose 4-O-acetylase-like acetyltransferase